MYRTGILQNFTKLNAFLIFGGPFEYIKVTVVMNWDLFYKAVFPYREKNNKY